MNQIVLCHFQLVLNDKLFQLSFQPGISNFDDMYAAVDAFRVEIDKLKEQALEAEAKAKAEKEATECAENCDAAPVEAEVVA